MTGILVFFHCESNPGFAAASHELSFVEMARRLVGPWRNIHFAYRHLKGGRSPTLPPELNNVIEFDATSNCPRHLAVIEDYVRRHNLTIAFGFDQPVRRLSHKYLRRGGIRRLISYWGAPMGSINGGAKLLLKQIDVALARYKPDHFIFQSEGMRETAIKGRGIAPGRTSLVRTGIRLERFRPPDKKDYHAHDQFGIGRDKKIIFFSGHVDLRKGVDVLVKAAVHLVQSMGRSDFHLLIVGNKPGQEATFTPLFKGTAAERHITFGGYRNDVPKLLRSCSIGFIGSTAWDSFPMSSIEMAATGLPLVVSDLPGLREAVNDETGLRYPPGDSLAAADRLARLLDNDVLRRSMGAKARQRAVEEFSVEQQIAGMEAVVRKVAGDCLEAVSPKRKFVV